jgi:hypothetical protein
MLNYGDVIIALKIFLLMYEGVILCLQSFLQTDLLPALKGEEVRYLQKIFLSAQIFLVLNGTGFPKLDGLAR